LLLLFWFLFNVVVAIVESVEVEVVVVVVVVLLLLLFLIYVIVLVGFDIVIFVFFFIFSFSFRDSFLGPPVSKGFFQFCHIVSPSSTGWQPLHNARPFQQHLEFSRIRQSEIFCCRKATQVTTYVAEVYLGCTLPYVARIL